MTTNALFFVQRSEKLTPFKDLDRVAITHAAVTDDGDTIPAGTEGTVVDVIRDGLAYAVEFPEPLGALATVLTTELHRVEASAAQASFV